MARIELPHTRGCIVCGRDNPHGMRLNLHVDVETGLVTALFTPGPRHIGFEGIIHGGVLATVLDEAMVWAATWTGQRFCVCGELNVRYRLGAAVGEPLSVEARVTSTRSRLVETSATARDVAGRVVTSATGKYVPVPPERNRQVIETLVEDPDTAQAARALSESARRLEVPPT